MKPVWILLGIMIILLVVKTTIIAALSYWIHKLRKRDVRTHYNMYSYNLALCSSCTGNCAARTRGQGIPKNRH